MNTKELFDLNIKDILENWTINDALRELIANAYDETFLSQVKNKPIIDYDEVNSIMTIKDYGRGINIHNFVQNENDEKKHNKKTIGKFGIGLKDSIAVLFRKDKKITLQSKYGFFKPVLSGKNIASSDIKTIHISCENNEDEIIGTIIKIYDIGKKDYEIAIDNFLYLSMDSPKPLLSCDVGEIFPRHGEKSYIYYNGMKVSSDDDLLFSYNLLDTNAEFDKSLNRERKFISRDAYRDLIIKILKNTLSNEKQDILQKIYDSKNDSTSSEWNYVDVKFIVLNAIDKKILISNENTNPAYKEYANQNQYEICTLNKKDYESLEKRGLLTLNEFGHDYVSGFSTKTVDSSSLDSSSKENWDNALIFLKDFSYKWIVLKNIFHKIDFQLIEEHPNACGIANLQTYKIEIVRNITKDKIKLMSTLFHEICHLISQKDDATLEFEETLCDCIGYLSN